MSELQQSKVEAQVEAAAAAQGDENTDNNV